MALPLRCERGRDEGHSRSDVPSVELAALQLRDAADDDPMRIAEEKVGAHRAQLLEGEQPQLVHPVVHQRLAFGLRGEDRDEAHHVARESRPQARRDASGRCQRRRRHDETIVVPRAFEAHLLERGTDDLEVGPAGAGHLDRATRDCGNDSPTSGLDVVAIEPVRRTP